MYISIFFSNWQSLQVNDGDYISFFDGRDLQSHNIQKLDKADNFKKLTISSSSKDMLIQFKTDNSMTFEGFKASFHYVPIEPNCINWLNLPAQRLESPENPKINCSWIITAPSIRSTIAIHFETFEVKL